MKILFIQHSCFVVEIENKILIFDWFDGSKIAGYEFHGVMPEFDSNQDIYLFASHKHQDHFDLNSLKWIEKYPNMHFILSKDIRLGANYLTRNGIPADIKKHITFVKPCAKYEVGDVKIQTLRSTDAGVAFLIDVDGQCIYHAGDLNDWCMEGAGELINGKMQRDYRRQVKSIGDKHVDFAFVVLDPRLKEHAFLGIDFFLKTVDADYVFPMHMWQETAMIEKYLKTVNNRLFSDRIIRITGENQTFNIEEE